VINIKKRGKSLYPWDDTSKSLNSMGVYSSKYKRKVMPPKNPPPKRPNNESYPQDIFFLHTHGIDKRMWFKPTLHQKTNNPPRKGINGMK
jgi:hypothetical protein